ncbi:MAG: PilZ domain-containing protein [Candidatus Delongbacteria bacterium]|nr:PilZ domain-containing protein [Candidatus Delongbacteria bacterium]
MKILKNLQENQYEIAVYIEGNKFFGQISAIQSNHQFTAVFEDYVTTDSVIKSKRIDFEFRVENEIYKTNLKLLSHKKEGSTNYYSFNFPEYIELDPFFKYYRITPSVNHPLMVTFILVSKMKPLGETLQLRIRDISIEGFTFVVPNINVPFYPGFILKSVAISGIDANSMVCDARIRNYERNMCTISYLNLSDQSKEIINRYIISSFYQQKKMHEDRALETDSSAGSVETPSPKVHEEAKAEEKRSNLRLLIIDNHPDECLVNLEKIHRVKIASFDNFELFYRTIFPKVILFNPGYIKGYEILQHLADLNKERQIPIIIIYRQLSPAFQEQLTSSFHLKDFLSLPFIETEFNELLESVLSSAGTGIA